MHHTKVYKLFINSRDMRKRLVIYCLKDAELPLKLMEKFRSLYSYAEMAKVTGVTAEFCLIEANRSKFPANCSEKPSKKKSFYLKQREKLSRLRIRRDLHLGSNGGLLQKTNSKSGLRISLPIDYDGA